MKICIVYPDIISFPPIFDKVGAIIPKKSILLPPLGVLYILSNSKSSLDFIDNRVLGLTDEALCARLRAYDVVGFAGTITEIQQARTVSQMLRKEGVFTLYGGPNATINYEKYVDNFDVIVRGEGEQTLNEVLARLEQRKALDGLPGIAYKKDGQIVCTPERPFIKDLDTLAYPAREGLSMDRYSRKQNTHVLHLDVHPVDTVASGRGCPFGCAFCSSKTMWRRTYRKRSPEAVCREVAYMADRFGTRGVYFREDLFTAPRPWVLKFCELIRPMQLEWMCESRVDTLDHDLAKAMRGAGCKAMWFGIESGSDETLQIINKGVTIKQAKVAVAACRDSGIACGGAFMFGFPHETKDDMLHTLQVAQELGLDWIGFSRLIGFPRSPLYDMMVDEGLARLTYEDIIIPDTRHLDADTVNEIGYSVIFPAATAYNAARGYRRSAA